MNNNTNTTKPDHVAAKKRSYRFRVTAGQQVFARRPIRLCDYRPLNDGTLDRDGNPAWGHITPPITVPAGTELIVNWESNAGDNGIVAWVYDPVTLMKGRVSTGALSNYDYDFS